MRKTVILIFLVLAFLVSCETSSENSAVGNISGKIEESAVFESRYSASDGEISSISVENSESGENTEIIDGEASENKENGDTSSLLSEAGPDDISNSYVSVEESNDFQEESSDGQISEVTLSEDASSEDLSFGSDESVGDKIPTEPEIDFSEFE